MSTRELPTKSNAECEEAIRKFAEITKRDEAFAHFMLQDDDFNLDRALSRYYSSDIQKTNEKNDEDGKELEFLAQGSRTEQQLEEFPPAKKARPNSSILVLNESKEPDPVPELDQGTSGGGGFPEDLTLLTWNIDGLDESSRKKRFHAVLVIIAKANPEVVFLQEMVGELMGPLNDLMQRMYHIFVSDPLAPYFCVTLVSKNIKIICHEVLPFSNTGMFRSMTIVEGELLRLKLRLINTHLESMAEYAEIRKVQLELCMDRLRKFVAKPDSDVLTIFGGDLNIRKTEVPVLPDNVRDAWEAAGQPKSEQWTWDMSRNDNKDIKHVKCRFDRVYFSTGLYANVDFHLDGTRRIRGPNCFPSDHFAIVCKFYGLKNAETSTSQQ